jgi:phage tail-like protein
VTHDPEFEKWAGKVRNCDAGPVVEHSRKDIIIEVYDEAGHLASTYKIYHCWVSEFQALPDPDANANAVLIQHMNLEK